MSKLYNARISVPAANVSATSAAAGYPASNAMLQSLGLPWRSTVTTQTDLIVDLGSARTVRGIGFSDINALSGFTIASSADNVGYTDRATPTFAADRYGRIRGVAALNTSARYWRIRFASGTPADGAAFWRIGALYLFGAVTDIVSPKHSGFKRKTNNAEIRTKLDNGRESAAAIGIRHDVVSGQFGVRSTGTSTIGSMLADLRAGAAWIDFENPYQPSWTYPFVAAAEEDEESNDQGGPDYSVISFNAREVV